MRPPHDDVGGGMTDDQPVLRHSITIGDQIIAYSGDRLILAPEALPARIGDYLIDQEGEAPNRLGVALREVVRYAG